MRYDNIAPQHITPQHSTSHHNTPHYTTPHHTTPHHITSHHITPHQRLPSHPNTAFIQCSWGRTRISSKELGSRCAPSSPHSLKSYCAAVTETLCGVSSGVCDIVLDCVRLCACVHDCITLSLCMYEWVCICGLSSEYVLLLTCLWLMCVREEVFHDRVCISSICV